MYNIVLDRLPTEYKGYLIRSDFRIGIQISMCLSDSELETDERISSALFLLFGKGMPDIEIAYAGLLWFLSCGKEEKEVSNNSEEPEVISFKQDINLIYSAFRKCYNIDLAKTTMHWFEFSNLLADISNCAMTNIIEIRSTKLSDIDKRQRPKMIELKEKYAIVTEEQEEKNKEYREAIEKANKLLGI